MNARPGTRRQFDPFWQASGFGTIVRCPAGNSLGRVNVREVIPPFDFPRSRSLDWIKFVMFEAAVLQPGSPSPVPGMDVEVRFVVPDGELIHARLVKPVGWCVGCSALRALYPYRPERQQGASGHCESCFRKHGSAPHRDLVTPPDRDDFTHDAAFGRLGEELVARICRDQGLCVTPYGIEHTSEDLRKLARLGQMESEAGRAVRAMPDLAVYWPGEAGRSFWLLEVKTRRGDPVVARHANRYRGMVQDRWYAHPDQLEVMRRYWSCALLVIVSFSLDPESAKPHCLVRARGVADLPEADHEIERNGGQRLASIDVHGFQALARVLLLDEAVCQRTIQAFLREREMDVRRAIAASPKQR